MTSVESRILNLILRLLNMKCSIDKAFDTGIFGKGDMNEPPKRMYLSLEIENTQAEGRNVFVLKRKNRAHGKHILYLHGGAYIHSFNRMHWEFIGRLIRATGCTIVAPDYPLAPDFTYLDSFKMVTPIYRDLIAKLGGENVILMGDSSGGGFALALAQCVKREREETAQQVILLSPWLDIALGNKDIDVIESKDPILGIRGLQRAGKSYAGDTEPGNYLLSPINGDLKGLGEVSIFIGTHDILVADTRRFKRIAEKQGVEIRYFEYEEMLHVWMFWGLPESQKAFNQIVSLVNLNTRQSLTQ